MTDTTEIPRGNGTNGHGPAPVVVNVLSIPDVAKRMGVTTMAVRYWAERGHLTPVQLPEDPNRQGFDEGEIETFERVREALQQSGTMTVHRSGSSGATAEANRDKADGVLFRVIERLDRMNEKMFAVMETTLTAREANLNATATRELVSTVLTAETHMKEGLAKKAGHALDLLGGKLLAPKGGPAGVPFLYSADLDRLKMWLAVGGAVFTKDQQGAILRRVQELESDGSTLGSSTTTSATDAPSSPAWTQVLDAAASSTTTEATSSPATTEATPEAARARKTKKKTTKGT